MTIRTTTATITFKRPFMLRDIEGPCPAGSYEEATDEASIDDLSFLAWHRVATIDPTPAAWRDPDGAYRSDGTGGSLVARYRAGA